MNNHKCVEDTSELNNIFNVLEKEHNRDNISLLSKMANVKNFVQKFSISLKYNNIELRKSNIHGLGLFATTDIPKNKIVTFYPAHSVSLVDIENSTTFYIDSELFRNNHTYYHDLYTFGENSNIYGDYEITAFPEMIDDTMYLGHMINDGCGNVFDGVYMEDLHEDLDFCDTLFTDYNDDPNNNCEFNTVNGYPICYISTTRPIKKGEELLTQYGIQYWYGIEYPKVECVDKHITELKTRLEKYNEDIIFEINN